jgi:hypothetical protein
MKTSSASASVRERELRDFDIRLPAQGQLSVLILGHPISKVPRTLALQRFLLLDSHLPIRHVAGWVRSVLNCGFACSLPLESVTSRASLKS